MNLLSRRWRSGLAMNSNGLIALLIPCITPVMAQVLKELSPRGDRCR